METKIQVERKFKVKKKKLPDLSDFRKEVITQWYLTKPNKEKSVRIRKYNDGRCYIDMIYGFGKIREKLGKKTDWEKHKDRIHKYPSISKTRYKKEFGKVLMVVDVFHNIDLIIVEIESNEIEVIDKFKIPKWFGKEVTEKKKFTNNWLAYNKKN